MAQVPLLGYLVKLTGNLSDSHDLLQQTNLTAWQKRADYATGSNAVAWMRSIARNHYRNYSRSANRSRTVPLLDDDVATLVEARSEERELEETRKRRLLHLCIEQLPERHRQFITAFYIDGRSLIEVGDLHGVNANAVSQMLHRARQNLIRCVRQKSHEHTQDDL